jgi:hypothetical protein
MPPTTQPKPRDVTLQHSHRLELLSAISGSVAQTFADYLRCYDERRVIGADGGIVPDISARLKEAQARVMRAVEAFERAAATELAALEGRKSS